MTDETQQPRQRVRRIKSFRQRHRVPRHGFSDHWLRYIMRRPKKTDRRKQIRYMFRLQTGLGLALVVSSGGACTWYVVLYPAGAPSFTKLRRWPAMSCADAEAAAKDRFFNP